MSKRFGGKYSPDERLKQDAAHVPVPPPAPRHPHEGRPKWITIAAFPMVLGAFFQGAAGMVTDLAAFGLIASGMWMTREGLVAQAVYESRRVARRPAIPRKLFGAVLAGAGLGLAVVAPGRELDAVLVGAAGVALHVLAFGPDPMRDKHAEGVDSFQQDRAARMIAEAETHLAQMTEAITQAGDRRLEARVAMFAAAVHHLFDRLRENPGGLSSARRYLGVYLMGARDATLRFADLYARTQDQAVRTDYLAFLDELEQDFLARADKLAEGDRAALDLEMSVLRERLAREGLTGAATSLEPEDRPALQSQEAQTLDQLLTAKAEKVPHR
ncbi:MAG: 5-bromo-4-chloroindolyl phosphate hydrolysis family protein [Paracoccus sp. (in: a-proteobacteria)]|nr:5-bromo-4-chloroindolyl phosphate hydrolysis family protein [Paracoccus sp. (in: a-proteobacteria)]